MGNHTQAKFKTYNEYQLSEVQILPGFPRPYLRRILNSIGVPEVEHDKLLISVFRYASHAKLITPFCAYIESGSIEQFRTYGFAREGKIRKNAAAHFRILTASLGYEEDLRKFKFAYSSGTDRKHAILRITRFLHWYYENKYK